MRKLVDNNLIKVIDGMSETPYEEYKYMSTPMEGFQIAQGGIEKTNKKLELTFEGKIEPYSVLSLTDIENITNIGTVNGEYKVEIHLPEIITQPFEINGNCFFDNEPTTLSFYVYIPQEYGDGLPLCLAENEETVLIKHFQGRTDGVGEKYIAFSKNEDWVGSEEAWVFGYKQGMFYINLTSL